MRALGKLFRSALSARPGLVPLSEELGNLSDYMTIQGLRYSDRLLYSVDASGAPPGLRVVRLSLQVLVENALVHGLEPRRGRTSIAVAARLEGGFLELTVRDDGAGCDPQEIAALMGIPEAGGRGFALSNLAAQLSDAFGPEASLRISSAPGGGTLATIRHPAIEDAPDGSAE